MRDVMSSRNGSLFLAFVAALIAGILIFLFIDNKTKEGGGAGTQRVLVAKSLIPKGTSGDVIAANRLGVVTAVDTEQVKAGAVSDTAALRGQVAAADIYPGEQITTASFAGSDTTIQARLTGYDRAISVPVDAIHGLVGNVQTGDRVDVLASMGGGGGGSSAAGGIIKTLATNVLVLQAPSAGGGTGDSGGGNIILRADDDQVGKLAWLADNARVWIVLRPGAGAKDSARPPTTGLTDVQQSEIIRGRR